MIFRVPSSLILLIILFLAPQKVASQNFVSIPAGNLEYINSDNIKQHEKKGGYYNEFWNYHIVLDNGSEIYLNYSITHYGGVRDAVSGARLSLINWNGKNYNAAREYNLNKFTFSDDTYKFDLNPERGIWFEGRLPDKHLINFNTKKNGTLFDIKLDFADIKPGFTWGDGKFLLGNDDEAGLYTPIPFARVTGFVALNGDTVEVSGIASMNQVYQTNVGTKLFQDSFRFYSKNDGKISAGYFLIPKDSQGEVVGYAYEINNSEFVLKKPVSLERLDSKKFLGEKIYSKIKICYLEQPCEVITVNKMNEKISMLDELGGFKKMLAKRFLGGDIIELRGSALINNNFPVFYSTTLLD